MFKYTAHPDVLHRYEVISRNSVRPWDDHYHFAEHIVGGSAAYFSCGDFWRHYKAIEFYSQDRLVNVPINGILIPAKWFKEEIT